MMKHLMLAANAARLSKPTHYILPAQFTFRFSSDNSKPPNSEAEDVLIAKEKALFDKVSAKEKHFL